MDRRIELQNLLEELFGSDNVYYQPPESIKMSYPAIKYSKIDVESTYANDKGYTHKPCYEIIVIDKKPDNPIIYKLLELPYCSFDRHYAYDNLNHDVLTLYY